MSLVVGVLASSFMFFSNHFHEHYESELDEIVTYIEHNADADDLKQCFETGESSPKRDELQAFLNRVIDDFDVTYLYIVVPAPEEGVLYNVVSATSQEERDRGETDMLLRETTDVYSKEDLLRYQSFWDKDGTGFFEEATDKYGSQYTAVKPLKGSDGKTVALICADVSIDEVQGTTLNMVLFSIATIAAAMIIFVVVIILVLHNTVTKPMRMLEESTDSFAKVSSEKDRLEEVRYEAPTIKTGNEVQSLADAISDMATNVVGNVERVVVAEKQAQELGRENARLAEEAAASQKIQKLSESLSTLLDNMPVMTFYKDVEYGKYMACNQSFATYAGKNSPSELVGLTDFDIFDEQTAAHFVKEDKIALSMDKPHVFYEDIIDVFGKPKQFQTTKLKFTDPYGNSRVLGMCIDITEMVAVKRASEMAAEAYEQEKNEKMTYARIASALSLDYVNIFYVDITNDDFIEYSSYSNKDNLSLERHGHDFFAQSKKDALRLLHKDDQQVFITAFTKENVLDMIERSGTFNITYRLIMGDKYKYVTMKATRLAGDDHIIIGVSNVDEQVKDQEALERIHEERITYSRITALAGDYICIYTIDPETDDYYEYSAKSEYEGLGIEKSGKNFFETAKKNIVGVVYYEDVDMVVSAMNKENVLAEIKENGVFSIVYRLMINGEPTYVTLKAALVDEKDGPQLIMGVSNVDAQVKREQAYEQNLSFARKQADIDALTGVKNKHAYIDLEAQLNHMIDENQPVDFAVVICDINELKVFNDTYGHVAGDEYIISGCRLICEVFKHSPVFRVGGDEFAVIAQGGDYDRIDHLMSSLDEINRKNKAEGKVIVAAGMAKFENDRSVAAVFERADQLMYQNKREMKQ